MGKNAGIAKAREPGLWRRKQSSYGLLCALGGTRQPITYPRARTPAAPQSCGSSRALGGLRNSASREDREAGCPSTLRATTAGAGHLQRGQRHSPEPTATATASALNRCPMRGYGPPHGPSRRGSPHGPRAETVATPRTPQPRNCYRGAAILVSHDSRHRAARPGSVRVNFLSGERRLPRAEREGREVRWPRRAAWEL